MKNVLAQSKDLFIKELTSTNKYNEQGTLSTLESGSSKNKPFKLLELQYIESLQEKLSTNAIIKNKPKGFQVEIEKRFQKAIRNRSYSFPRHSVHKDNKDENLSSSSSGSSLKSIKQATIYNLYTQNANDTRSSSHFEITNRLLERAPKVQDFKENNIEAPKYMNPRVSQELVLNLTTTLCTKAKKIRPKTASSSNDLKRISQNKTHCIENSHDYKKLLYKSSQRGVSKKAISLSLYEKRVNQRPNSKLKLSENPLEQKDHQVLSPGSGPFFKHLPIKDLYKQSTGIRPRKTWESRKDESTSNEAKSWGSYSNDKPCSSAENKHPKRELSGDKSTNLSIKFILIYNLFK